MSDASNVHSAHREGDSVAHKAPSARRVHGVRLGNNLMWRSENPEAWDLLMQYRNAEPMDGSYPMEWDGDGRNVV